MSGVFDLGKLTREYLALQGFKYNLQFALVNLHIAVSNLRCIDASLRSDARLNGVHAQAERCDDSQV